MRSVNNVDPSNSRSFKDLILHFEVKEIARRIATCVQGSLSLMGYMISGCVYRDFHSFKNKAIEVLPSTWSEKLFRGRTFVHMIQGKLSQRSDIEQFIQFLDLKCQKGEISLYEDDQLLGKFSKDFPFQEAMQIWKAATSAEILFSLNLARITSEKESWAYLLQYLSEDRQEKLATFEQANNLIQKTEFFPEGRKQEFQKYFDCFSQDREGKVSKLIAECVIGIWGNPNEIEQSLITFETWTKDDIQQLFTEHALLEKGAYDRYRYLFDTISMYDTGDLLVGQNVVSFVRACKSCFNGKRGDENFQIITQSNFDFLSLNHITFILQEVGRDEKNHIFREFINNMLQCPDFRIKSSDILMHCQSLESEVRETDLEEIMDCYYKIPQNLRSEDSYFCNLIYYIMRAVQRHPCRRELIELIQTKATSSTSCRELQRFIERRIPAVQYLVRNKRSLREAEKEPYLDLLLHKGSPFRELPPLVQAFLKERTDQDAKTTIDLLKAVLPYWTEDCYTGFVLAKHCFQKVLEQSGTDDEKILLLKEMFVEEHPSGFKYDDLFWLLQSDLSIKEQRSILATYIYLVNKQLSLPASLPEPSEEDIVYVHWMLLFERTQSLAKEIRSMKQKEVLSRVKLLQNSCFFEPWMREESLILGNQKNISKDQKGPILFLLNSFLLVEKLPSNDCRAYLDRILRKNSESYAEASRLVALKPTEAMATQAEAKDIEMELWDLISQNASADVESILKCLDAICAALPQFQLTWKLIRYLSKMSTAQERWGFVESVCSFLKQQNLQNEKNKLITDEQLQYWLTMVQHISGAEKIQVVLNSIHRLLGFHGTYRSISRQQRPIGRILAELPADQIEPFSAFFERHFCPTEKIKKFWALKNSSELNLLLKKMASVFTIGPEAARFLSNVFTGDMSAFLFNQDSNGYVVGDVYQDQILFILNHIEAWSDEIFHELNEHFDPIEQETPLDDRMDLIDEAVTRYIAEGQQQGDIAFIVREDPSSINVHNRDALARQAWDTFTADQTKNQIKMGEPEINKAVQEFIDYLTQENEGTKGLVDRYATYLKQEVQVADAKNELTKLLQQGFLRSCYSPEDETNWLEKYFKAEFYNEVEAALRDLQAGDFQHFQWIYPELQAHLREEQTEENVRLSFFKYLKCMSIKNLNGWRGHFKPESQGFAEQKFKEVQSRLKKRLALIATIDQARIGDEPFGALIQSPEEPDFSIHGLVLKGEEVIARIWTFIQLLKTKTDQDNAKTSLIHALADCYEGSAMRVCNPGKVQRLITRVLQGNVPGIALDNPEGPVTIAQISQDFFRDPEHAKITKWHLLMEAVDQFFKDRPNLTEEQRREFQKELTSYASVQGIQISEDEEKE